MTTQFKAYTFVFWHILCFWNLHLAVF